jgi:hypothetical protein
MESRSEPLALKVRLEDGKYVVSHPESNSFVESRSLDQAYRQMSELLKTSSSMEGNAQEGTREALLGEFRAPAGSMRTRIIEDLSLSYWISLAAKTAYVATVGVVVVTLLAAGGFMFVRPYLAAAVKNQIGPAALARKLESMDPDKRAIYQENLSIIVNSLQPFAATIRPLIAAAIPPPAEIRSSGMAPVLEAREKARQSPSSRQESAPILEALPPKRRLSPD